MQQTSTGSELRALPARILIVDADPDTLQTLSDSVTGLGYAVCHAAEPGPAALELPVDARPDLAVIGLAAGETAAPAVETAGLIAERFGVPLVYAMETADTALLDRTQRTNPHGYVLKSADALQLGLTIRAALNATARERADRERQAGAMAGLKASVELAERDNAMLRCLFERISDAVIVGDTQGRLTAINPAARRLGKAPLEDPNGWTEYFTACQADGRTPFALEDTPLARALRGQTTQDVPVLLRPRRPDAGTADVWLSASGYPVARRARPVPGRRRAAARRHGAPRAVSKGGESPGRAARAGAGAGCDHPQHGRRGGRRGRAGAIQAVQPERRAHRRKRHDGPGRRTNGPTSTVCTSPTGRRRCRRTSCPSFAPLGARPSKAWSCSSAIRAFRTGYSSA